MNPTKSGAFLPDRLPAPNPYILRAAQTTRDIAGLQALYLALHPGDGDMEANLFGQLLASIQTNPGRQIYVLEETGEHGVLQGTVDVFMMENLSRGGRPWIGIENFVVDPARRRQGLGSAILQAIVDLAVDRGAYKIQLISANRRMAAHEVYERLGFDADVRGFRKYL